jgi:hypothetical protein
MLFTDRERLKLHGDFFVVCLRRSLVVLRFPRYTRIASYFSHELGSA